jgi:hypothetical protein
LSLKINAFLVNEKHLNTFLVSSTEQTYTEGLIHKPKPVSLFSCLLKAKIKSNCNLVNLQDDFLFKMISAMILASFFLPVRAISKGGFPGGWPPRHFTNGIDC